MTVYGLHVLDDNDWPVIDVTHVRLWDCGVTWRHVNPARNVFDWKPLDDYIATARANGVTNFTYVLGATPAWAARSVALPHYAPWLGPGSNSAPHTMSDWERYVRKAVSRYKGIIQSYQVWNEPQLMDFWGERQFGVLATMTRIAYDIIKDIDPDAKVVAAPVLPRPSSGGMKRGSLYLRALKAKRWPCDVYAAHMYPEIGRSAGRVREFAVQWRAAMSVLDAPTKPKWITEINANLLGGQIDDAQAQDFMHRVDEICEDENIKRCYWYAWGQNDPMVLGIPFRADTQGTRSLSTLIAAN